MRADVLAATLDALAVVGYPSLRLEDVATRAGVHKTTVYRHWPTKAELVTDALLDRSQQRIPVAGQAAAFSAERIAATRPIVERAQERGELAADIDPTLVIETLIGPIWVRFLLTGEPLGDNLAADIARLICRTP